MNRFFMVVVLFTLGGCGTDSQPSVVYPKGPVNETITRSGPGDTTRVLVGELPFHFDSTDYLLFPVGTLDLKKSRSLGSYVKGSGKSSYARSYEYNLSGEIDHLMVQHRDSLNLRPFNSKNLHMENFIFLQKFRKKTGKHLVLIKAYDLDTNQDGVLNNQDVAALFLAYLNGQKLTKLTPDLLHVQDFRVMSFNNRVYFRCQQDTNKDGEFTGRDKMRHFFVQLDDPDFAVSEYDPLAGL